MIVLPGTEYARYLMPLDYPPSRSFVPRWGYSQPPLRDLLDLFAQRDEAYREVIEGLKHLRPFLSKIPREFSHERPEPGWLGIPMSPIDAALIYYFITVYRPSVYLEVGSGASTCFARRAIDEQGTRTRIVSLDPDPRAEIDAICDFVVRDGLENADLSIFSELRRGDVVFIDGSHRAFMNSDVTVFMLDVLPRLRPGVVVQIHDILLPYDYPDSFKHWYWNEQYLVAVYLLGARDLIQPLFPSAYVTRDGRFEQHFDEPFATVDLDKNGWYGGGSLWFTHTQEPKASCSTLSSGMTPTAPVPRYGS